MAAVTAPRLAEVDAPNFDGNRQLRASFGDGPSQLLDTGLVELASIRVTPARVRWRRDGIWREHRLPAPCVGQGDRTDPRTAPAHARATPLA